MPPGSASACCILCGGFIHHRSPVHSWRTEFRAVRVSLDEEKRRFLTGVGGFIHRDTPFSAPSDPNQRYDDEGYRVSPLDEFLPFPLLLAAENPGYVFHDMCWNILKALTYPDPVPIDRFYDICRSVPVRGRRWLDWGHNYGGLVNVNSLDPLPWEEVCSFDFTTDSLKRGNIPYSCHKENPWEIPTISHALGNTQGSSPQVSNGEEAKISRSFQQHADCFSILPVEICEEILTLLLTEDVTSLRLASRSFASLSLSQYFWASRFRLNMDRDYIFEARIPEYSPNLRSGPHDWRALYHMTGKDFCEPGPLANRQRIWGCNRSLAKLVTTKPLDEWKLKQGDLYNNIVWKAVGGAYLMRHLTLRPARTRVYPIPCNRLYDEAVRVPLGVCQLAVSFTPLNDMRYVSGIRLISNKEPNEHLGYIIPESEVFLDLPSEGDTPKTLSGFIAAVGPSGIRALRATMLDGTMSQWAGCPDAMPITLRLRTNERISHLRGGFDGFKMVELAVPDTEVGSHERAPHLPLRTTAIWYPDIPPENLYLHESTFPGKDVPQSEYHPLVHVMFGGPQGSYLKYLTRISATISGKTIVGLSFEYDSEGAPVKRLPETVHERFSKISFPIDGPGGEILTGIQVTGDYWMDRSGPDSGNNGGIELIKIATNRARTFTFRPNAIGEIKMPPGPQVPKKIPRIEITPNTTITGIYMMHDSNVGMIALGPISERLHEGKVAE
ncbi:hypothetical protein FQN52_003424 [Onygenales sp. PD_12]|nr:hypothetical protein FQN53_005443 [Emmonsiellopsis sp. PD_33]KAK2792489.1 hypothetical protein FQN52_003424 [Onygenales sp. PD_12]